MSTRNIRILLVDDHAVVRQGFRMILAAQADMEIVGEAGNGREAIVKAAELHPDVVVMDVAMPELNGIEATRRLLAANPHIRAQRRSPRVRYFPDSASDSKESAGHRRRTRSASKPFMLMTR